MLMATLQLKSVPDQLHERLRERAAESRTSMRDYVLGLIEEDLERPSFREWSDRLSARGPVGRALTGSEAAELIREGREERDKQIEAAIESDERARG